MTTKVDDMGMTIPAATEFWYPYELAQRTAAVLAERATRTGSITTENLRDLHHASIALEDATREAVADLRGQGKSWDAIGAALGITKQAAAKRFGEKAPAHVESGPELLDVIADA